MSLAGQGPKSGSKHVCLIIASTGQQGPVLYKGDKDVIDAAHPPESGPAEIGGLSTSSLPVIFDARPAQIPDGPARKWGTKPTAN